jgi:hypothetical protein
VYFYGDRVTPDSNFAFIRVRCSAMLSRAVLGDGGVLRTIRQVSPLERQSSPTAISHRRVIARWRSLSAVSSHYGVDLCRMLLQFFSLDETICVPIQNRQIFKARHRIGMVGVEGLLTDRKSAFAERQDRALLQDRSHQVPAGYRRWRAHAGRVERALLRVAGT